MSLRPKLKICGVTNAADMQLINGSGADYVGILVEVGYSERSISLLKAREIASASTTPVVILLCNPTQDTARDVDRQINPAAMQLLCLETPDFISDLKPIVSCQIWKSLHLPAPDGQSRPELYADAGADALLIDSIDTSEGFMRMGGTGNTVNWSRAADLVRSLTLPVFLSGGINPGNVANALRLVKPFGIDLCSGVEMAKGKKDPDKLRNLVDQFEQAVNYGEKD